jgi:lysophospholipase L1-like esterase
VTETELKISRTQSPSTFARKDLFSGALKGKDSAVNLEREKLPALLVLLALALTSSLARAGDDVIRYVAIGDSYSIGEGATPEASWPALLARNLNESLKRPANVPRRLRGEGGVSDGDRAFNGVALRLVANPSRTGWTTQQAIDRELPILIKSAPTFATLQIGVNDWVQGVNEKSFRERFSLLVDRILEVLPRKDRLLIVTIPDFGITPTGARYAGGRDVSAGISAFNRIIVDEAGRRALRVVDVFELSRKMKGDSSLVAADGLHPSAREYAEWEKLIEPAARALLTR